MYRHRRDVEISYRIRTHRIVSVSVKGLNKIDLYGNSGVIRRKLSYSLGRVLTRTSQIDKFVHITEPLVFEE